MVKSFPRFLLAFAALVLAVGALMHASAFHKVLSAIIASNLAPFAANSLKVLWLGDSTTCLTLALVFGFIAARPFATTRSLIVILSFIPAATVALIYTFIGSFVGGHMLLVAAVAALIGGLQYQKTNSSSQPRFPIGRA
jgi:hypothetical protein